jgi:hypothetical protein
VDAVARTLAEWYRGKKLEVQILDAPDRVVVQCQNARWRSVLGMSSALTVVLRREGEDLTVEIGRGRWAEKAAVAGAGLLLGPLLVTAGYGLVDQARLSIQTLEVVKKALPKTVSMDPPVTGRSRVEDLEIVETSRTVEDYRVEPMVLNNLKGTSALKRTVTINKEWSQSYVIGHDTAHTSLRKGDLKLGGMVDVGSSAEKMLTTRYSITQGAKRSYTDQIIIEVPAHTMRRVLFDYKLVWQHGIIKHPGEEGLSIEIPFRVAVDLTLDLTQEDEGA